MSPMGQFQCIKEDEEEDIESPKKDVRPRFKSTRNTFALKHKKQELNKKINFEQS